MVKVNFLIAICAVPKCLPLFYLMILMRPSVETLNYERDKLAPIVLVPGVSNTQIEGKWNTLGAQPPHCEAKSNDWEHLFLSFKLALLGDAQLECWAYRFKLVYSRFHREVHNQFGVMTREVGKLGSLQSTEYLTNDPVTQRFLPQSKYFRQLIKALVKVGYLREYSVNAHGYDWRYAPPWQDDFHYYSRFVNLVEKVANETRRKVMIAGHSMGALVAANFLMEQPQAWKDKYIHAFVSVGAPWLGSPKSIISYIVGDRFGIPTLNRSIMLHLERSFQSIAYLLPQEEAFKDTTLVDWTKYKKKYTAKDYLQFFLDINFIDGYLMRQDVLSLFPAQLNKLGVNFHCVWSNTTRVETPLTYQFHGDRMEQVENYDIKYTVGDGIVPLSSLRYCDRFWGPNVTIQDFHGLSHRGVINHKLFHEYVLDVAKDAEPFEPDRPTLEWPQFGIWSPPSKGYLKSRRQNMSEEENPDT